MQIVPFFVRARILSTSHFVRFTSPQSNRRFVLVTFCLFLLFHFTPARTFPRSFVCYAQLCQVHHRSNDLPVINVDPIVDRKRFLSLSPTVFECVRVEFNRQHVLIRSLPHSSYHVEFLLFICGHSALSFASFAVTHDLSVSLAAKTTKLAPCTLRALCLPVWHETRASHLSSNEQHKEKISDDLFSWLPEISRLPQTLAVFDETDLQ